MKVNHALVFVLVIVGITYLAYKNHGGVAGMFTPNSDGSALGGPVYSSIKANIGMVRMGKQPNSYESGNRSVRQLSQRYVRGQ